MALTAPWAIPAGSTSQDWPFDLERIAGGVVAHRAWREARDGILGGLAEGKRIIVLLGEPGAGKTLLMQQVERELAEQGRNLQVIDDADRKPPTALTGIGRRADTAWLLTAQRGFKMRARLWGDAARLVWLRPMPPDEVARFIAARLQNAGRRRSAFEPEAVLELARRSEGLPRRVLTLAGDALRESEAAGEACVTPAHVRTAVDRRILRHPPCRPLATIEPVVLPTPLTAASFRMRRSRRPSGLLQAAGYGLAFTAGGAALAAMMLGLS